MMKNLTVIKAVAACNTAGVQFSHELRSIQKTGAKIMRLCGFTLAEILITLAIIGVVAAFTIPVVVNSYQKKQTVVRLQKVYSELYNAVNLSQFENGNISTWDFTTTSDIFVNKYIAPYLKLQKNCGIQTTGNQCTNIDRKIMNNLNTGYVKPATSTENAKIVTLNGTLIWFYRCRDHIGILADINGDNPPNTLGKEFL